MAFYYKKLINPTHWQILILVLLIAAIIPFLILAAFCHPSVDDFWLTNMVIEKGVWPAFVEIRQEWSGRYISMFLTTINPLTYHSLIGYKILPIFLVFLFIHSAYFLISAFIATFSARIKWLIALLMVALFLGFMPVVSEAFYWMSGALNYQTGCIALLYLSGLFVREFLATQKSGIGYFLSLFLIFIIVGNNETIMAFMFHIIVMLNGLFILENRKFDKRLIGMLFITAACCFFVISAPGNAVRSAEYPHQGNLGYAMVYAAVIAINNSLNWLTFTPILLLTIIFIPFCKQLPNPILNRSPHPVFYWLVLYGGLFTCFFVSYYSKADHAPLRVQNTIYLIFIIGWFFNIYYSTKYFTAKGLTLPALPSYVAIILIAAAFLMFFHNKQSNIRTAYTDLLSGKAARYNQEMYARYDYLKKAPCRICPIKPVKNIPKTIFFEEVEPDTSDWRNKVTARYFGKQALLIKKK